MGLVVGPSPQRADRRRGEAVILVGPLSKGHRPTAHMVATGGVTELHAFARKVGITGWSYHGGRHPHYDLRPVQRAFALGFGATAMGTDKELMRRLDGK
jgi:hypothetical protein